MNENEVLEFILIIIIIGIQLLFFLTNVIKIRSLSNLYPSNSFDYKIIEEATEDKKGNVEIIDIIEERKIWSKFFKSIVVNTNNYLKNNKGSVANFDLIKNISERENDKLERSIIATIPVPLYIGLMGTMLGIVYGLFAMGDLQNLEDASRLNPLLSGVKIAMIGSIFGLFLTLIGSAFIFRNAKLKRDNKRNMYYNFIEISLLPVLSTDADSNIAKHLSSIANQLLKFNRDFKGNTQSFKDITEGIMVGIDTQVKHIQTISQIDFNSISHSIISMYQNISVNLDQFKKFNEYQESLNNTLEHSTKSIDNVDRVFDKIASVENNLTAIFSEIQEKIVAANEVVEFIKYQYQGIENVSDTTRTLVSVQQQNLENIYGDFKSFLDETKISFSDWAKTSVSDSKSEMRELSASLKDDITNTFDDVKTKIDNTYANESIDSIQKDIRYLKQNISKDSSVNVSTNENIELNNAILALAKATELFNNNSSNNINNKVSLRKTAIYVLVFLLVISVVSFFSFLVINLAG